MFNVFVLIKIVRGLLSGVNLGFRPPDTLDVDVRTARYYTTIGLMSRPEKVWRDSLYDLIHVKQLLAIKLLQTSGYALKSIEAMFKTENLDDVLTKLGYDPNLIEKEVSLTQKNKVYIIVADRVTGPICKIGTTSNPDKRVAEWPGQLVCLIDGASDVEAAIHERFKSYAIGNECFTFSEEIKAFVEEQNGSAFEKEIDPIDESVTRSDLILGVKRFFGENIKDSWNIGSWSIDDLDRRGLLPSALRSGKVRMYSIVHFRSLVAAILLRNDNTKFCEIKKKLEDAVSILDHYGIKKDFLDSYFPIDKTAGAEIVRLKSLMIEQKTEESKLMPDPNNIIVEMRNKTEFDAFNKCAHYGDHFVFVDGLPEDTGKALHLMLYGQKAKINAIKRATLPITLEQPLVVPGAHLSAKFVKSSTLSLVADKDVYKEGDDVVKIFAFDPIKVNRQIKIDISVDGVFMESQTVSLNKNGCGLLRIQAVCCGKYTVTVQDEAKCSFDAVRYTLDPLTVTLSNSPLKEGDVLTVDLKGEAFSNPFTGKANIKAFADNKVINEAEIAFTAGVAKWFFSAKDAKGNIGLRVTANGAIANVPLSGTSQEQREDTQISSLGRVTNISLLRSATEFVSERGLFFTEGALNNSPISMKSCIASKIELTARGKIEDACVIICEPDANGVIQSKTIDVDFAKERMTWSYELTVPFASVHVGAFVEGKPWEGHAMVFREAKFELKATCQESYLPSDLMELKLSAKKAATVFIRIADKRMRTQETPVSAAATRLKEWAKAFVSDRPTGHVTGRYTMPTPKYNYAMDGLEMARGGPLRMRAFGGPAFGAVGIGMAAPQAVMKGGTVRGGGATLYATGAGNGINLMADVGEDRPLYQLGGERLDMMALVDHVEGLMHPGETAVKTGALKFNKCEQSTRRKPVATPVVAPSAREMDSDLIYTGLVEVDGKKPTTLKIKLPDSIGLFDITAFAVSDGDWTETRLDFAIDKGMYISPLIPAYAHPEDEVLCRAYIVRPTADAMISVRIDGKPVKFDIDKTNPEIFLAKWIALPGVHEVVVIGKKASDKIIRVIECPGEESVLAQELRILKQGETFDIGSDENALSLMVVPGMDAELKTTINVVACFEHYCCEQTSAIVMASALACVTGDDSAREKSFESIIKGGNRLKSMYQKGKGFSSYPGQSINAEWSTAAARRVSKIGLVLENANLPEDVQKSVDLMSEMGEDVLKHATFNRAPMENAYYSGEAIADEDADSAVEALTGAGQWDYTRKSEAAFCGAALIKAKRIDKGIKVANAVNKVMAGTMGGAMHGSYESLAYLHMIAELKTAGVVSGAKGTEIKVNGKKTTLEKAMNAKDVMKVEAVEGACAVKITRLERIKFDEVKTGMQMSIDFGTLNDKPVPSNSVFGMTVKIDQYKDGDVLCVALPDCYSRIIAGCKVKKFQLDFQGKTELNVELVAHDATAKPQRFAAIVRNMYDGARIGSVGLLAAAVK